MGLIYRKNFSMDALLEILISHFGEIDSKSDSIKFDMTDYYKEEFGNDLLRKFITFKKLTNPEKLAEIKIKTNDMEKQFSDQSGSRCVNIDPGILSLAKVMLATTKDYSHRVPLQNGIYAEVTLSFKNGTYVPHPWTYPDYQRNDTIDFFNKVKDKYKSEI
ncbi:MAG: DUF4416 family protein [bacterium]